MAEYFFELLAEEIPAWMHEATQSALRQHLAKAIEALGAEAAGPRITVSTTPRRIAFFLGGLSDQEPDREQEVKGPPRKAAYDAEGRPTQALHGFLKKNDATANEILESQDEYIRMRKRIQGRKTADVLSERVPQIIESLRWPKMMRWGTGEHAWIRPVHSIVSILDEQHLPITIFGVESGTTTTGHRTLSRESIDVRSYGDYVTKLELGHVVVDPTRRGVVMANRARVLANEVGGVPAADTTILSQWQYLTEFPGLVRAEFGAEYLALPEEVLVTVMRVHQKQLPIRDSAGKLTSSFLAVLDNNADPDGHAAYGNAFVTNARFADAKFFYETDRRTKLEDRVGALEHLQFQEKLGNYLDKTRRIEAIAAAICTEIGVDSTDVLVAARLCKADLGTEMVKEFTDLQGKIGGIYAREEGLPGDVWQAIYDHYLPLSVEDALPRTTSGAIVSLADKMDTLAGFFRIGARPTGSKDPFALRRAAQAVVQILLGRGVSMGLDRLVEIALDTYGDRSPAVAEDLLGFFAERVRTLLEATLAYDEIAAAMEAGWARSLSDLVDRATALREVRDQANFLSILDSAKRIANITEGHDSAQVDASKLENDVERRLNDLADVVGQQVDEMIAERKYRAALESFAAMAPELETFFRDVMVNVDDASVRRNRMSLLRRIGGAVAKVADVTKIVVDRRDYR